GLSGPRWPPEQERQQVLAGAELAEQAPRPEEVLLADEFRERSRAHALRERLVQATSLRVLLEEVHGAPKWRELRIAVRCVNRRATNVTGDANPDGRTCQELL